MEITNKTASSTGLIINKDKTATLRLSKGLKEENRNSISIEGEKIDNINKFNILVR